MAQSVTFPHQVAKWPLVRTILKATLATPPFSGKELVDKLKPVIGILHHQVDSTVFNGLKNYLKDAHWQKREIYFSKCFPTLLQYALDIEKNAPQTGLQFALQNVESRTVVPRKLVASIVACSFLCLWPGRKYDRHSLLNGINFFEFFRTCGTDPGQAAKLECILHYFEVLAEEGEPTGDIIFHRQMLIKPEIFSIKQWESSAAVLCPCEVYHTGRIEDAGPKVVQVDFANRKIGGGVLTKGKVQEEIRFSICPELVSGLLFMEAMTDHEAIVIQGFQNYCDYSGYRDSFRFTGPYPETAQKDCHGNLENYLCAIDALPFKDRLGGPGAQYHSHHLQRELNKAFIGFRQDFLEGSVDPLQGEYTPARLKEEAHMRGIVETYFASLSETILTKALQESLVSLKEESSSPSPVTSSHSSSHSSSGQNGRTVPEGVALDYARRRSSNLSDTSSRRSSSTAGSRRSSGNQLTSSECSELEEYYQAYQTRHSLKPSVIKEEIVDSSENPSDVHELADQVMQSIFAPGVLSSVKGATDTEVKAFSKEQPKAPIVRPKARVITSSSHKQPLDLGGGGSSKKKSRTSSQADVVTSKQQSSSRFQRSENKSFDSVDSTEDIAAGPAVCKHVRKDTKVEFKPSHLTFRPPRGKSPASTSKSPLKTSSSSSAEGIGGIVGGGATVRSPSGEPPAVVPDHLYSYSGYLADCVMDHAWREVYELYVGERYRSDSYSSSGGGGGRQSEKKGQVEGFIGGIVENVWNYSAYNIRKHYKTKQEQQQMWTSDSDIDLDLDVYIYADDFVQDVMREAVVVYKTQKQEELKKVEAMWQKAQEKFETDAKYFNAEFSRYWQEVQTRQSHCVYQKQSRVQLEMQRRRSLDETGRGYNNRHGRQDARLSGGFRDASLSMFERQLLKSAGEDELLQQSMSSFERELLSANTTLAVSHDDFLLSFPALRRASEPVATTRRASLDVAHLCPSSERRRGSSVCSTSSREMILDWLNQSQRRSSSSSGNSRGGRQRQRQQRRTRTTSSHLDWYAQDLLLEAFNDALKDIFGDVHSAMVLRGGGASGGGDLDSVNNSFSSSQSNDHICDTYIAIPVSLPTSGTTSSSCLGGSFSSFSKAKHPASTPRTRGEEAAFAEEDMSLEERALFSHESVQLSSSPVNNSSHLVRDVLGTNTSDKSLGLEDKNTILASHGVNTVNEVISNNRKTTTDPQGSNSPFFQSEAGRQKIQIGAVPSSDWTKASGVKSKTASHLPSRTKSKTDQTLGQSTAAIHLLQADDTLSPDHPLVEKVSGGPTTTQEVKDGGRAGVPVETETEMRGERVGGQRSRDRVESLVGHMMGHMMEGMCENLSNEVLEGAVHTLNTHQRTEAASVRTEVTSGVRLPIATGNWGCGAYRGDAQLKALLQWMAASQRGVPLFMYYTFADKTVAKLHCMVKLIQESGLNVGALMVLIKRFCDLKDAKQRTKLTLFEYIEKSLRNK